MKSMTGYGRSKLEKEGRQYQIEIKSVNHKYSDVSVKLPRSLSYLEDKIRKEVANYVTRGKVDVFVTFINNSDKGKNIKINKELAQIYIAELEELASTAHIKTDYSVMDITKLPEVLTIENEEDEDLIWEEVKEVLNQALESFIQMRTKEGEKLAQDIQQRAGNISKQVERISQYSAGLVEEYVVKLRERIKEILKTDVVDETRLAQEVVIYSDKCSIEEELTRLRSHLIQLQDILKKDIPVGKKLDFLVQEMNRETNTIGSKANSLDITNLVIEVKTEIENIREQIQNIE